MIDYRRCPDGKTHNWTYTRYVDGAGVYSCNNCDCTCDKVTLKFHTDVPAGHREQQMEIFLRSMDIDPQDLKDLLKKKK